MLRIGKSAHFHLRLTIKITKDHRYVAFLFFLIFILLPYVTANWDPYEVIGVRKDANLDQIKKAYRELARKLHPDKSNLNEGEAGKKFIELNKAFNILKDPDRRSRYDQHGETEESRHSRGNQNHQYQGRHFRDQWTHNGYRTFTFFTSDGTLRKKSITSKQYHAEYVPQSKYKPFFIFFYAEFCPSCSLIESTWTKITEELKKYNVGSFTIDVHQEPRLSHDLGASSIPHIACLIDGQIRNYHQSELSLNSIVQFTRKSMPSNLVVPLDDENDQDRFIALGPQHNRLSVLIIHNESSLKLRYLLLAFHLREYYRFGSISTKLSDHKSIAKKYNLALDSRSQQTTMLVFDENYDKPLTTFNFKSDEVDINHIKQQFLSWPFLKLPKISSQQRFDDLCYFTIPKEGDKTRPRLCVILFAPDKPSSLLIRKKMLDFISINRLQRKERVVFAYLDPIKQKEFVDSLQIEMRETFPAKKDEITSILLIERHPQDSQKSYFKWLNHNWSPENLDELDRAKLELYQIVESYLRKPFVLSEKVVLGRLIDEEGPSFFDRIYKRIMDCITRSLYYFTNDMPESVSTVIVLVICALITSFFLYQGPTAPTQSHSSFKQYDDDENHINGQHQRSPPRAHKPDNEFKILELKAETYNGLVRLLKPGFRSIILLTDSAAKDKLLPIFEKAVWPYRRNKTLHFGYLCLDKNLVWYKSLLQEILGVDQLRVNKKKCIGTVLSLNGFKKYVRVYHNKHHEIEYDVEEESGASFLGFDNETSVEDGTIHISDIERCSSLSETNVENLLTRLPLWLDKMFDGMTKRYFLDSWPEEMY